MATSPTAVSPPSYEMSAAEVQTLSFDMTPDLAAGQSVTGVSVALTNIDTGAALTLSNAFSLATPVVKQTFDPATDGAVAGQTYLYRITYTASPSTNVYVRDLILVVTE